MNLAGTYILKPVIPKHSWEIVTKPGGVVIDTVVAVYVGQPDKPVGYVLQSGLDESGGNVFVIAHYPSADHAARTALVVAELSRDL